MFSLTQVSAIKPELPGISSVPRNPGAQVDHNHHYSSEILVGAFRVESWFYERRAPVPEVLWSLSGESVAAAYPDHHCCCSVLWHVIYVELETILLPVQVTTSLQLRAADIWITRHVPGSLLPAQRFWWNKPSSIASALRFRGSHLRTGKGG